MVEEGGSRGSRCRSWLFCACPGSNACSHVPRTAGPVDFRAKSRRTVCAEASLSLRAQDNRLAPTHATMQLQTLKRWRGIRNTLLLEIL